MFVKLAKKVNNIYSKFMPASRQKIFCIGMNKTGTTSLETAFTDLGYKLGNQNKAEWLLQYYKAGNFEPVINFCKTARVFQDFPFSYPGTYLHLDKAFPKSKFILSVRSNPLQWYNSFLRFYATVFGNGKLPGYNELLNTTYVHQGWMLQAIQALFKTPDDDIYNAKILMQRYTDYNNEVINYFSGREDDLLVINLAKKDAYKKFCSFLHINNSPFSEFPWSNKTSDLAGDIAKV